MKPEFKNNIDLDALEKMIKDPNKTTKTQVMVFASGLTEAIFDKYTFAEGIRRVGRFELLDLMTNLLWKYINDQSPPEEIALYLWVYLTNRYKVELLEQPTVN